MTSDHSTDNNRDGLSKKDEQIANLQSEIEQLRTRIDELESTIEQKNLNPTQKQCPSTVEQEDDGFNQGGKIRASRRKLLATLGGLGIVSPQIVASTGDRSPSTGGDGRVSEEITAGSGTEEQVGSGSDSDPVEIGAGASAADTATVIGPNSVAPADSVVIGEGIDASGNDRSTIVGQSNASSGATEVVIGHNIDGSRGAVSVGTNVSNNAESVTLGLNAKGANRNSVAIGSHVNENAPSMNDNWPGIRVSIGSRAAASERGTAVGPGAGEYGTPGKNAVNIGNEASASGNYSVAIGDQREIGTNGNEEAMIKDSAAGAVAIGTSVEVGTAQVARIGTSKASNPSPRQFVIKGKDSDGNIRESAVSW